MSGDLIAVVWEEGGMYLPPPPLKVKARGAEARFRAGGRVDYVICKALVRYRERQGLRPAVRREGLLSRRKIRRYAKRCALDIGLPAVRALGK